VPIDLAFVRDHAVNTHLALEAHGGRDWTHAHHGFPGGTSVTNPLEFAKGGRPPARWFTPIDIGSPELSPRYRWGVRAMRFGSLISGVPLPGPTLATFGDPSPVVRWMADELARWRTPHPWGYASTAVLIAGGDGGGRRHSGRGSRWAARRDGGAAWAIGRPARSLLHGDDRDRHPAFACVQPQAADDMHFLDDRHALISRDRGAGRPASRTTRRSSFRTRHRLCCSSTSAWATARYGGYGCGLAHGWGSTSRRTLVREADGQGITFLDVDVIRVLEFCPCASAAGPPTGGSSAPRDRARPEVVLFVDPSVGALDEHAVADAFLEAIGGGSGGERLMELQWREARMLRVVRESPRRTASGKILHLHLDNRGQPLMSDRDAVKEGNRL
jgi:hypothetical protein